MIYLLVILPKQSTACKLSKLQLLNALDLVLDNLINWSLDQWQTLGVNKYHTDLALLSVSKWGLSLNPTSRMTMYFVYNILPNHVSR